MASCAMACRTASRTHTGPGRKKRTSPGLPPVGSKGVVMSGAILSCRLSAVSCRLPREPRGQLDDRLEERVGSDARKLLARARAVRDQHHAAPGGPSELEIHFHVADDDR